MNTSQPISPLPPSPLPVIKPTFYNAVLLYNVDYPTLQTLATKAGVTQDVMDAMFTSVAIHRVDAKKILAVFSEYTGVTWNLDNVRVGLLPTFEDICTQHGLDRLLLATQSDVPYAVFDMMLTQTPVSREAATRVLAQVSRETGKTYTLDMVDMVLEEGQVGG